VPVGVAGGLALIWASLGVFGAITRAVNEAWGAETQRSFWKHRMVSFLMLVAAGSVTMLALVAVSAVQVAEASWFGVMLSQFAWLSAFQSWVFRYAATILLILAVGLVYYFIPNAKTRFRDVWVGAVFTGVLWTLAFRGFSWYPRRTHMSSVCRRWRIRRPRRCNRKAQLIVDPTTPSTGGRMPLSDGVLPACRSEGVRDA
jgi:membrane protein